MQAEIKLLEISMDERRNYMNYLLLADDSTEVINEYIHDGDMYAVIFKERVVGVVLFTSLSQGIVELKNIALEETYRGSGIGRAVIHEGLHIYRQKQFLKMMVGTANSSITNIAFYQKVGFRIDSIKKDFFNHYPNDIYENGIKAQDMIMFSINLTSR